MVRAFLHTNLLFFYRSLGDGFILFFLVGAQKIRIKIVFSRQHHLFLSPSSSSFVDVLLQHSMGTSIDVLSCSIEISLYTVPAGIGR